MSSHATPHGTVVVGVNGSTSGALALVWAAEQASRESRSLTVVNALNLTGIVCSEVVQLDEQQMLKTLKTEGQLVLDEARSTVADEFPGLSVVTVLSPLEPRLALLALAKEAAMLVIGSRVQGPIARTQPGPVSAATIGHAACPVVVLRPRTIAHLPRGMVVGVDRQRP